MKYGLIGEKLSHSFSKEIHTRLCGYDYELKELKPNRLDAFFEKRDFCGINVTIPYKKSVIKYLDSIDTAAESIGAVNTVVNKGGKLYGYNTDATGLEALINKSGVTLAGKKVLILGSGGTSDTALFVAKELGAANICRVSRTQKPGFITYDEAVSMHNDAQILINTTPVGMFPDIDGVPVDLARFCSLDAVFDVIYNPLKSRLLLTAHEMSVKATGGLYMLVSQARSAAELFLGCSIDDNAAESVYRSLLKEKRNIVLIGMPASGKTTIGKILAQKLNMRFYDSDDYITSTTGKTPAEIITSDGEQSFRKTESKAIYDLSLNNNCVIATGGGAVTVEDNIRRLKANGRIYYINRQVDLLDPGDNRPVSPTKEALVALYGKRKELYEQAAEFTVLNNTDIITAAETIKDDFLNENFSD